MRKYIDGKYVDAPDEPSEEILPQPEPTVEERLQALEAMELERILGGGF